MNVESFEFLKWVAGGLFGLLTMLGHLQLRTLTKMSDLAKSQALCEQMVTIEIAALKRHTDRNRLETENLNNYVYGRKQGATQ